MSAASPSLLRKLLRALQLMLPVLVPSWRFFDAVAPSPRVQYRLLSADASAITDATPLHDWHEFRPRAPQLPVLTLFKRLCWNAQWNEQLFITSCAERILEQHTWHSEQEIAARIAHELRQQVQHELQHIPHQPDQLQFRLLVIERRGDTLQSSEHFRSSLHRLAHSLAATSTPATPAVIKS